MVQDNPKYGGCITGTIKPRTLKFCLLGVDKYLKTKQPPRLKIFLLNGTNTHTWLSITVVESVKSNLD